MKSLRLIIFAGYYHPYRGGYVESIHGLAKGLVAEGHVVTVVTPEVEGGPDRESIDGVTVVRLPGWHILNNTYPMIAPTPKAFKMLWQLWREPVDVVSTQTRFFVTSFLGAWFALTRRRPLFHTERGAYHSVVTNKWVDVISRFIDHTLGWAVIKIAKQNVGVSKAACVFLKHLGARSPRFIPNGVTIPAMPSAKDRSNWRKQWSLKDEDRVLLFLGRLIYGKGCQDALSILPALIEREPNLQFVIAGNGPYRAQLESQVTTLALGDHVKFIGLLNGKEVQAALDMADVFVNPSHSEGLPRSVLEAAATGLPIVATDVGGTTEIITHETSGLIVPAENPEKLQASLQQILADADLRQRLGHAAKNTANTQFSWPKIIASYQDLMSTLV